jgi:hypothetical protein
VPRNETILRIFVSSPSDMDEKRALLRDVVRELNVTLSQHLGVRFDLVGWETHAYPSVGVDAQNVINDQIGDDYDIFVGMMWNRFGTPTSRAGSGTVEEFERAYERFCENPNQIRIMFYFKDAPVNPSLINPSQLEQIHEFRDGLRQRGILYWTFRERDEFASLLRMHLSRQVLDWHNQTWGTNTAREASTITVSEISDLDHVEYEEVGLLDLVEQGEESFTRSNEAVYRMTDAVRSFSGRLQERFTGLPTLRDARTARRVINQLVSDMEQFVVRMEAEIPIFSECFIQGSEAIARGASLLSDFTSDNEQVINGTLNNVNALKEALTASLNRLRSLRTNVANIPRVTIELNRAKRRTLAMLDDLIYKMQNALSLISEIESELQGLLS